MFTFVINCKTFFQTLFIAHEREIPSVSPPRNLKVSQTYYGYTWSIILSLSCGRIFKLEHLLSSLKKKRSSADSLYFVFPKVILRHVCGIYLDHRYEPAYCASSLASANIFSHYFCQSLPIIAYVCVEYGVLGKYAVGIYSLYCG